MRSRKNSAAPLLMLAAAATGLAQTQPPRADEKPASVSGEVRNAISGMPVERAHISLRRYNNGGWDKYGALTNAEGKYTITGIPAATYQVTLDRVGFVAPVEVTRNALVLKAGEKKDDFKVKLVPVGAISGRVVDAEGQPVEGINVYAEVGTLGQRMGGVTDDRGQFRISGLNPGKYRVRTVPQALPLPPEIRTDGTAEVQYASTYHPGAVDEKGGTRVIVGPASDVTGVDIRMVRTPIIRVAGKVSGMPEGVKNVYVQMMRANGGQSSSGGPVKPDGSFEIWRPDPGKYNLRAMYSSSGEMMASGAVEVEVGESDIDNVELRLLASEDLRAQVNFDDEGAKQAPQTTGSAGRAGGSAEQLAGAASASAGTHYAARVERHGADENGGGDGGCSVHDSEGDARQVPGERDGVCRLREIGTGGRDDRRGAGAEPESGLGRSRSDGDAEFGIRRDQRDGTG